MLGVFLFPKVSIAHQEVVDFGPVGEFALSARASRIADCTGWLMMSARNLEKV